MAKPASETLFVRLPAGTRARLQALADADLADMSTIARRLILRGLEAVAGDGVLRCETAPPYRTARPKKAVRR